MKKLDSVASIIKKHFVKTSFKTNAEYDDDESNYLVFERKNRIRKMWKL